MKANFEVECQADVSIKIKNIFEPAHLEDGVRIFVDRHWPRGLKKTETKLVHWAKEVAPSSELSKWISQDLSHWDEFVSDYVFQLRKNSKISELIELIKETGTVTLLYASPNRNYNSAQVLKKFIEKRLGELVG